MSRLKKAVSIDELLRKKFVEIPLTGRFGDLLGRPEASGTWFIKGPSGEGKTTFILQLIKELTNFGKVIYNSLEEGARLSMQEAFKEQHLTRCERNKILLLHREKMDDMRARLRKSRGVRFVVIDSIQYAFMSLKEYKEMQADNADKVFIINSHVKGKYAIGALAHAIEYDSDQKIDVDHFVAYCRSRGSRGKLTKPYVIWEEGAQQYWNDLKL